MAEKLRLTRAPDRRALPPEDKKSVRAKGPGGGTAALRSDESNLSTHYARCNARNFIHLGRTKFGRSFIYAITPRFVKGRLALRAIIRRSEAPTGDRKRDR